MDFPRIHDITTRGRVTYVNLDSNSYDTHRAGPWPLNECEIIQRHAHNPTERPCEVCASTGIRTMKPHRRWQECKECAHLYSTKDDFQKHDQGKPMVDLIPPQPLLEVAQVFTYGAKKYSAGNWTKAPSIRRYMAATMRHILAFMSGENTDPESGLPHLAHAATNLMIIMALLAHNPESDDRDLT
ncbi:MAG: dATP/dGTP diphosphohydrolase domain-containing protein [Phycisphaerales bacterium JB052]